jgi:hypothetical protein
MRVLFTPLVMLCLALDFGDPNVLGASSLEPDETVEVVQFQRMPTATPPALSVTPEPRIEASRPLRRRSCARPSARASLDLWLCSERSDA